MTMKQKEWEQLSEILGKATRKQLDLIDIEVAREIRLSETAIKEGFEKNKLR